MQEVPEQADAQPNTDADGDAIDPTGLGEPARTFLVVTTEDRPGCPAGSAVNRVELTRPLDPWPGHEMIEDDGRELWTEPPAAVPVPASVPNSDLRIVLQGRFLPDGRSLFTATDAYLAGQRDATAALGDQDPEKRAALMAWTQWDMGNLFYRADPLVDALGRMFRLSPADLDALFLEAADRA